MEFADAASCNQHCFTQSGGQYPSECRWFWLGGSRTSTDDVWKWIDRTIYGFAPSFFKVNDTVKSGIVGWLKSPGGCYGKGPGWHDLYVAIECSKLEMRSIL